MGKKKHKKYLEQKRLKVSETFAVNQTTPAKLSSFKDPKEDQEVDSKRAKNLIKYKYWYLGISALLIIPGLISLGIFGLKTSIDFSGGSVLKFVRTEGAWNTQEIEQELKNISIHALKISVDREGKEISIRTKPIDSSKNEEVKRIINDLLFIQSNQPNQGEQVGQKVTQTSFETVGSSIGAETARKSVLAVVVACVGIVLYIAYAFRNIPKPYSGFRFGVSAILAMIHDVLIVTGIFSILGHFKGVEVDPMFITALLTIIGFSVHDTIVVFDRIRENLFKFKGKTFEWVANFSILETMRRSIATSATVAITLSALMIFGGESIRYFVLALLIGVISGTYSSIFNATPILVIWEDFLKRSTKKF